MSTTLTIDKRMWELMGTTFYSIFFALLWSALFLWEHGVFKWNNNNYTIYITTVIIILFIYYIMDWMDANLASSVDTKIKKTDIFLWLLSTMWLSTIIVLFIKKFDTTKFEFLYIPVFLSLIYCFFTTFLRDRLLAIKIQDDSWAKERQVYDNAKNYIWFRRILLGYVLILIPPILLCIHIHYQGIESQPLDKFFTFLYTNEMYIPFIFIYLLFIPSLIMKILRTKWILKPISEQSSIKAEKEV